MASITIRGLHEGLKRQLRIRAAEHGCSMAQEARDILRCALNTERAAPKNPGAVIHERFKRLGGVELDIPPRERMREPPAFD